MSTLITVHIPLRHMDAPEDTYPTHDVWAKPIAFQVPPREGDQIMIVPDPDLTHDLWRMPLLVGRHGHRGDGGYEVQTQDVVLDIPSWNALERFWAPSETPRPRHLMPTMWEFTLGAPRETLRAAGWAPLKEVTG